VETGTNGIHIVGGYSEYSHSIYKDKLYWSNDYKENPFNCQYETGSIYIGSPLLAVLAITGLDGFLL
jgi:hypothetical protein